jgi:hypothetical protein
MKGKNRAGQPRIYEDESNITLDFDRFGDEGDPVVDAIGRPPRGADVPADRPRTVRSIQDGRSGSIALDSVALDERGWWIDLDAIVGEDGPGMRTSPLVRRPDRTGGEYEVCFERCPSVYFREPSPLPSHQSWCMVTIVPDTRSWEGLHHSLRKGR